MIETRYIQAADIADALQLAAAGHGRYLGGGTNLVDLMRQGIEAPTMLVDVSRLSAAIQDLPGGGVVVGAAATNTAVTESPVLRAKYPVLVRAVVSGASPQIRNMATVAGNLLQRTRCPYFYDVEGSRCNKRSPGQRCDALEGPNRNHAVLGASDACVATHPSDMAVALAALNAEVLVTGKSGERTLPLLDLHRLPDGRPDLETTLQAGDLITAVRLPPQKQAMHWTYRKVRDRSSYAFALVSIAAGVELEGDRIRDVRIALGGVAAKPWRAFRAEQALVGVRATPAAFLTAADAELAAARTLSDNAFKVPLARRTLAAVLEQLTNGGVQ